MIDTSIQSHVKSILASSINKLTELKITANMVTVLGLILGISASATIFFNNTLLTLGLFYLSGFCDVLDGLIARHVKQSSPLGTLMDISFDRIVEVSFIIMLGIKNPASLLSLSMLLGSIVICMSIFLTIGLVISNETQKSFFYAPGLIERTEAFILFSLLIIFPQWISPIAYTSACLILITAIQRFLLAIKILRNNLV
ncbi:MAG: CDP-alcohol phosphatidyltransferase family protein [Brevinema sp.]